MAADGWQRVEARPSGLDPPPATWTVPPATHVVHSVLPMRAVEDEDPLPSLAPLHPRVEKILGWLVPWWATRRAAARLARRQHAIVARINAARGRGAVPDLASPAGARGRGSRYWSR